LVSILKAIGAPGSISFLAVSLAIGAVLIYVWPRSLRLGRGWLLFVFITHVVLALPWVATRISGKLPPVLPVDAAALRDLDTLIVLDGDNRRGRVREAKRAFAGSPRSMVWAMGSLWMVDGLVEAGIPRDQIKQDDEPPDTLRQMTRVKDLLSTKSGGRAAVIASRLQMPRVAALVRESGLRVVLIPSAIDTEPPTSGVRVFVPSYVALRVSRDAIYELAALAYYGWRGWVRSSGAE